MTPQGPEMGELEAYMSLHPELMDTADEEMDDIEGDEFANAEALDAALDAVPEAAPEAE